MPKVELTEPKRDLLLPANEIVDIAGEASDDQGLARIEQHIRVNEAAWKKVPLAGESEMIKRIVLAFQGYLEEVGIKVE